jgi:hypothetical protein
MLHLPALIEPLADRPGYRGRLGEPFNLTVEAPSPEEAVRLLTAALEQTLARGAQVVRVSLPGVPAPSVPGWLPDDELTQLWREGVEAYRRECDAADRQRILGEPPDGKVAS